MDNNQIETGLRFLHILSAITWIGLLYFFNLVNLPVFKMQIAGGDPAVKGGPALMLRALFWFRWAAMSTVVFGLLLLDYVIKNDAETYSTFFKTAGGEDILVGMILAIVMWFNVWFIIWPNQKVVLNNNIKIAKGVSDEEKKTLEADNAPRVPKAKMASRINFWLSIPMLFFMVFATHAEFKLW